MSLECFREFIETPISGYVFDHKAGNWRDTLQRGLVQTLGGESKHETISIEARKIAKSFELEKVSARYLEDFARLLL